MKLDAQVTQRARNAVMFLRTRGTPKLTLAELIDQAVSEHLDKLAQQINGGEDFPDTGLLPLGGQLQKGM